MSAAPQVIFIEPDARGGWQVVGGTGRFTTSDGAERAVLEREHDDVAVVVRDAYHRVLRINRRP
jgi:hypothetical protein